MYQYKKIHLKDLGELKALSEKEGLLYPKVSPYFIGVYDQTKLIGFGGLVFKKSKAIIKCDYVRKEYRRQGIARNLIKTRLAVVKSMGLKYAEANATELAVRLHLREGARVITKYKNGITKIAYENI